MSLLLLFDRRWGGLQPTVDNFGGYGFTFKVPKSSLRKKKIEKTQEVEEVRVNFSPQELKNLPNLAKTLLDGSVIGVPQEIHFNFNALKKELKRVQENEANIVLLLQILVTNYEISLKLKELLLRDLDEELLMLLL